MHQYFADPAAPRGEINVASQRCLPSKIRLFLLLITTDITYIIELFGNAVNASASGGDLSRCQLFLLPQISRFSRCEYDSPALLFILINRAADVRAYPRFEMRPAVRMTLCFRGAGMGLQLGGFVAVQPRKCEAGVAEKWQIFDSESVMVDDVQVSESIN